MQPPSSTDSPTTLDHFDDCNAPDATGACAEADACSGDYGVDIIPSSDSSVEFCDDFGTVGIGPVWERTSSEDTSSSADCAAGSGQFLLLPFRAADGDRDGQVGTWLTAVEGSGTGTMTNNARLTSVSAIGTLPSDLRVMKRGATAQFDASDGLVSASTLSWGIASTGTTTFSQDSVQGNPTFLLGDHPGSDTVGLQLGLAWTCPSATGSVSKPAGYQAGLSALGCSYAQKVTVRPRFGAGPHRLEIEPYGDSDLKQIMKLNNDDTFNAVREPFSIAGKWLGVANGVAQIRLDSIQAYGVGVCTPGTYTLAAE